MFKTCFVQFVLIDILYSLYTLLFSVLCKWSAKTMQKLWLPQMHFSHNFVSCQQKLAYYCIHFSYSENTISPDNGTLLKRVLNPNWLHSPISSCCLINFDILPLHTARFGKSIIFPLLVFVTLEFLLYILPTIYTLVSIFRLCL